jgi:hypothetical protein
MDFAMELSFIKNCQKEFEQRFNRKLIVDFVAMKSGMPKGQVSLRKRVRVNKVSVKDIQRCLDGCLKRHGARKETIMTTKKFSWCRNEAEMRALVDFSRRVFESGWNTSYCASLINRDRSTLYHLVDYDI